MNVALRPQHLDILSICTGGALMRSPEQRARYNATEREKRRNNPEYAEKRRANLRMARDPDADRERCRRYREANRERLAEQKQAYYQSTRKHADKSDVGRFKGREKKSRRRAACVDGTLTLAEWDDICSRHGHRCAYCGKQPEILEMDHVVALSRGGRHVADNIVPACKPCNSAKGAR